MIANSPFYLPGRRLRLGHYRDRARPSYDSRRWILLLGPGPAQVRSIAYPTFSYGYWHCLLPVVLLGLQSRVLPHGRSFHWRSREHWVQKRARSPQRGEYKSAGPIVCGMTLAPTNFLHDAMDVKNGTLTIGSIAGLSRHVRKHHGGPGHWSSGRTRPISTLHRLHADLEHGHIRRNCVLDMEPARLGIPYGWARLRRWYPCAHC